MTDSTDNRPDEFLYAEPIPQTAAAQPQPTIAIDNKARDCLRAYLGLGDMSLALFRLSEIVDALPPQLRDASDPNFYSTLVQSVCAKLESIAPRDEYEVELAQQRIMAHFAGVGAYRMATHDSMTIEARGLYLKFADKFAERHIKTQAALDKHRTGGKQKMEVTHRHINEGANEGVNEVEAPVIDMPIAKRMQKPAQLEHDPLPPHPMEGLNARLALRNKAKASD